MNPIRPSIPKAIFARWKALAVKLGWGRRGGRVKLLNVMMDYADVHPDLFRKR